MKILVISFFDDNFGDMLIRVCFDRLTRCALKNLGEDGRHAILHVHIKDVTENDVADSSVVFFAGGAMFGMNNLSTYENIELVTKAAEEHSVPVIFSSIGINNFHAAEDSADRLNAILRRKCVKAMSVRESADVFAPFTEGCAFTPVSVCDPAVWTRYIYKDDVDLAKASKNGKTIGINFVRGGLFKANGRDWDLKKEEEFINALRLKLEEAGYDYRFFTNGSVLDNNSLAYFAEEYKIPREKIVYAENTREVIYAVASCEAVAAIRMHAAIIAYSLSVPSINLVWNEKIPHFYSAIGYPDRAVEPTDITPDEVFGRITALYEDKEYSPEPDYMMTLYGFLLGQLGGILGKDKYEPYTFEQVCSELTAMPAGGDEDLVDYRVKLRRARHFYLRLFEKEQEAKKSAKDLEKKLKKAETKLSKSEERNKKLKESEAALKQELKDARKETQKLQSRLDYIYNKPIVKLYKKLRGQDKHTEP